ncbi:MAG: hypothetical protein CME66_11820 [Halobacteriovoraceae bacterium]|nr:hypothetical protein [Halobacteriovoraceae bacterium]
MGQSAMAEVKKLASETSVFSGRVSKLNRVARLARMKIDFDNVKFLNKTDRVEIWNPSSPERKCLSYVEGVANDYLLLRIPKYEKCVTSVHFTTGSYLHMYSPNLEKNIGIAQDLIQILHRKRTALKARLSRHQKSVDSYIEKVDVVNKRYKLLKEKLELEWQKELSALEEDKTQSYLDYKKTQARLHELNYKLEQYRVHDQNMKEDRWSLDPELYYKK